MVQKELNIIQIEQNIIQKGLNIIQIEQNIIQNKKYLIYKTFSKLFVIYPFF